MMCSLGKLYVAICLSEYDMKICFCLFERHFELQKNGVSHLEISFFVSEISTFFNYAN